MVRCVKGIPEPKHSEYEVRSFFSQGFSGTGGNKPIFFLNETYRRYRHELLTRMVLEDEVIYGSDYNKDGNFTGIAFGGGTLKVDKDNGDEKR